MTLGARTSTRADASLAGMGAGAGNCPIEAPGPVAGAPAGLVALTWSLQDAADGLLRPRHLTPTPPVG